MSLTTVDRFLEDWKDPDYTGFAGTLHYFQFPNEDINYRRSYRASLDSENIKYVSINNNNMGSYGSTEDDLFKYYEDFNMKPYYVKVNAKRDVYKRQHTFLPEYGNVILKYLKPDSKYILELGFTGGFISTFLLNNSVSQITTIDKMNYDYHFYGKNFIDNKFPGRHTLLVGSPMHLKDYMESTYDNIKFNAIYIDKSRIQSHIYNYLVYYKKFADENTVIFLKGTNSYQGWGIGAYVAMTKAISEGLLILLEYVPDNYNYSAMSILKYNFDPNFVQKLPLKLYVKMEYQALFREFNSFLTLDYESKSNQVTKDLVKKYQKKLAKFGISFNTETLNILKEKFNITLEND